MDTHRRDQGADRPARRLRPEGVTPLELWDHPARDTDLWRGRARPDFPELVRDVAERIAARERTTRFVLLGGDAARVSRAFPEARAEADPFFAAAAALTDGIALAIDVGQTSLKIARATARNGVMDASAPAQNGVMDARAPAHGGLMDASATRMRIERPSEDAPLAPLLAAIDLGAAASTLLALPCALDDACAPGPCTYPDVAEALASLARRAPAASLLVMNDAELAAVAARRAGWVPPGTRALVLTCGFGIGAAVVRG